MDPATGQCRTLLCRQIRRCTGVAPQWCGFLRSEDGTVPLAGTMRDSGSKRVNSRPGRLHAGGPPNPARAIDKAKAWQHGCIELERPFTNQPRADSTTGHSPSENGVRGSFHPGMVGRTEVRTLKSANESPGMARSRIHRWIIGFRSRSITQAPPAPRVEARTVLLTLD